MKSLHGDKPTQEKFSTVGKSSPRIEGRYKVSGGALYTGDNILPGMIWGKVLRSPYAHARIVRVDTARARSYSGVLAVLTAADIPEVLTGRRLRDMPMLARDRVRFIGEKVAVVAAEDRNIAEEAAQLIEVEYEELPPVFDPLAAITEGAPVLHEGLQDYKGLPKIARPIKNTYSHEEWLLGDIAAVITPNDVPFPPKGIMVEGEINQDMIVTADLNLELLYKVRLNGSVTTWRDRRTDLYPDWEPEKVTY